MRQWTEEHRLTPLAEHESLDGPPEEVFDALTRAAARACGAKMAAVSLLERQRQWFKAKVGLTVDETLREDAFCDHTVRLPGSAVMVVTDAALDPRFAASAMVREGPKVRFYAGAAIRDETGAPFGALCVMDDKPRPEGLTAEQGFLLQTLADQVSEQMRLRRMAHGERSLARASAAALTGSLSREGRLGRVLESGAAGWWEWDVQADTVVSAGDSASALIGKPLALIQGLSLADFLKRVDARDRAMLEDSIRYAMRAGDALLEEYRLQTPDGGVQWLSARGRCLYDDDGRATVFPCVLIDITARKEMEARLAEVDMGRELALRAAKLGRWDHQPAAGVRYFDARARELFWLKPGDEQQLENILARVHPEDRGRVAAAVAAAVDANRTGPFRQTLRVVDPDGGAVRWLSAFGTSQFESGVCTRFLGVLADVTAEELAAEHRRVLTAELNHRVKNTMALVVSLVMSSLRGMPDGEMRAALERRLVGLGRAHDLLTAENWSAAAVPAIVEGLIETLSLPRERIEAQGPALRLGPKPALHLALALHELATNAIKYGALANDTGRIRMAWGVERRDGVEAFAFSWTERGGPPVRKPERTGFGSRLVQRATAAEFRGAATLDYRPEGVVWTLTAPLEGLSELGRAALPGAE